MPFENAGSWRGSFEPGTVAFERSESVLRTESIGTSSTSAYTTASAPTHLTTSLIKFISPLCNFNLYINHRNDILN